MHSGTLAPSWGRSSFAELQIVEFGDELSRLREGAGDDCLCHLEKFEHPLVGDGIPDCRAVLARLDDVRSSQDGELLGEVRGLEADLGNQLSDGALPVAKKLEDPDTRRMGEGLEEIRLHLVYRTRHRS